MAKIQLQQIEGRQDTFRPANPSLYIQKWRFCKIYFTKIRFFAFFLITIRFISQKCVIFAPCFEIEHKITTIF